MGSVIAHRWGRYRHRLAAGHLALGRREDALGHAAAAVRHLQRSDDSRELVAAYEIVATCHQELGHLEAAATARRNAVSVLERSAPGTTDLVLALVNLGDLLRFQGHFDQAETLLRRALTAAPTDTEGDRGGVRATVLNAVGIVYKDTGRYHAAEAAYTEALGLLTTTGAPDDSATASLWHNLAGLAHARGDAARAATAADRAVTLRERALGPEHHLVAQDLAIHGAALLELGRTTEAEQRFARALTIFRARHPADQYDVAVNLGNFAACRLQRNDPAGAETLFRQGLAIKQAILGDNHPEIARQLNNLAIAVAAQHRHHDANDLHQQALTIARNTLPANHPLTQTCAQQVAGRPTSSPPNRNPATTPSAPTP
jgi:tetratricopeptide (TPR) repeat protein